VLASVSRNAREERIPIMDQVALARQEAIAGIREVATHLAHPGASGSAVTPAISTRRVDSSMKKSTANRVRPRPVHTSTVKKSAAARTSQWAFRNSVHVAFFARSGAGSRPVFAEDVGDGAAAGRMIEIGQGPLDPGVTTGRVFRGHAHDQRPDLRRDRRSFRPPTCAAVGVVRDQPTMPGQKRVRRHNRGDVS
jgi:hypothetical protein